jgi:hypothetical protein
MRWFAALPKHRGRSVHPRLSQTLDRRHVTRIYETIFGAPNKIFGGAAGLITIRTTRDRAARSSAIENKRKCDADLCAPPVKDRRGAAGIQ